MVVVVVVVLVVGVFGEGGLGLANTLLPMHYLSNYLKRKNKKNQLTAQPAVPFISPVPIRNIQKATRSLNKLFDSFQLFFCLSRWMSRRCSALQMLKELVWCRVIECIIIIKATTRFELNQSATGY